MTQDAQTSTSILIQSKFYRCSIVDSKCNFNRQRTLVKKIDKTIASLGEGVEQ